MRSFLDFGLAVAPDNNSSPLKSLTGKAELYTVCLLLVFVSSIALIGYLGEKDALLGALGKIDALLIGQVLLLSLANYALRSFRFYWLGCRRLGLDISPLRIMSYYIAGFAMSATPGKVGQALSSWFLKRFHGYPYRLTLPLVLGDRMTDVLASAMLCLIGLQALPHHGVFVFVGLGALGILCLLLARPAPLLRLIAVGYGLIGRKVRLFGVLRRMLRKIALLLTAGSLSFSLLLATIAWFAAGAELYLCLRALSVDISLWVAVALFSFANLAGGLTLLPGGLGGTEVVMVALLVATGVQAETALAATLVVRFATLWFGIACGFAALAAVARFPQLVPSALPPELP